MICCDSCPYWPTCEEVDEFNREVLGLDELGQKIDDEGGPRPDLH